MPLCVAGRADARILGGGDLGLVAARVQSNSAVYVSTGAIMWALDTEGAVPETEQCLMSAAADPARSFRSAAMDEAW